MDNNYLYIKVGKNNLVQNKVVYLEDVVKLYSVDKKMVNELNRQVILIIKEEKETNYMFSILKIIEIISKYYPDIKIINLDQVDFIVHYAPPKKTIKLLEYTKVLLVCFMVFFGAAFAIMTFNEDVSVMKVFVLIYELVMGSEKEGGTILEISYSVGIPLGIIVFFNHFSKLKLGNDPTPLEVQLRLYEENLDKTLIENANREEKIIDAD